MKRVKLYLLVITGILCISLVSLNYISSSKTVSAAADKGMRKAAKASGTTNLSKQEFVPSAKNVKLLGRTCLIGDNLWLALSGTGLEFTFTGTKADITLVGDNVAGSSWGEGSYCRIGIYANDKLVADELIKEKTKTITAFQSDTVQKVTIRIVKLSESASSTVGIGKIKVTAKGKIKPTAAKAHRIEFIGDSITCGYGVDDNDANHTFTTATENITKTYAYKTAQALNADYSMVAYSGYGIVSGYISNGILNDKQLVPAYYDKVGFSYGSFNSMIKPDTLLWNFKSFQPDCIVINLGTNDASYCQSDAKRQEEYTNNYVAFLKQVRAKNPNAKILCTLGMMGDNLYPCVINAAEQYSNETNDNNVYTLKFDVENASDGYGASWHPSEITHTKAADKLITEIRKIMNW